MTVYEFISRLQEALDRANTIALPNREVAVVFVAPNSGFCGPTVRPKFVGYLPSADTKRPTEARYGLTRRQIEKILVSFDVTLPPENEFV